LGVKTKLLTTRFAKPEHCFKVRNAYLQMISISCTWVKSTPTFIKPVGVPDLCSIRSNETEDILS